MAFLRFYALKLLLAKQVAGIQQSSASDGKISLPAGIRSRSKSLMRNRQGVPEANLLA